eukprot:2105092-Prymnesium_polylepis.1
MGVESATQANECAHCYAFDAEHIASPPRATPALAPRSDPPTAERPVNRRATRQPWQTNRTCTLRVAIPRTLSFQGKADCCKQ